MAGNRRPNRKQQQKKRRRMAARPALPPPRRRNWLKEVLAPVAVTAAALFRMVTDALAYFGGR